MLFIKEKQAEEVKLVFPKAKMIRAFSFAAGDEFNFFVASNLNIDLYEVKFEKVKAKLIKNISVNSDHIFFDPLCLTLISLDDYGKCTPLFLNLFKTKQHKGKQFSLEAGIPGQEGDVSSSASMVINKNQSTVSSNSQRQSMTDRALSLFRKQAPSFEIAQSI